MPGRIDVSRSCRWSRHRSDAHGRTYAELVETDHAEESSARWEGVAASRVLGILWEVGEVLQTAALWSAMRRGHRDEAIEVLVGMSSAQRQRLRTAVRAHERFVTGYPDGARAPDREWLGPLRSGHRSAAAAALLASSTLSQAVKYAPLDMPDAVDLPRALFPDDLDAFVEEWSARFLRNPKASDRIRGLDAMFDWAHEGLVPAPTQRGAVLCLATGVPGARSGTYLLRYLEERPCLIKVTFARIFDVDGVKGASLAQRDEATPWSGRRLDNYVIPQLVQRGHWSREMVLNGIERALSRGQTPYLQRWFHGLAQIVRG